MQRRSSKASCHIRTTNRKRTLLKSVIVVLILQLLFCGITDDLIAKKKKKVKGRKHRIHRVYNPEKTRAEAMFMLQTSEELSELANVEPSVDAALKADTKPEQPPVTQPVIPKDTVPLSDIEQLKQYLSDTNTFLTESEQESYQDLADLQVMEAEDDVEIDLSNFKNIWEKLIGTDDGTFTSYGVSKSKLLDLILEWLGRPYSFGGTTWKAIDCSAWVGTMFKEVDSIQLPRTAREQYTLGRCVKRNDLQFGDMVFFHTYSKKFASHVGIYLGDDMFAHASSSKGVTISSLNSTGYAKAFIGGKRLTDREVMHYKVKPYVSQ